MKQDTSGRFKAQESRLLIESAFSLARALEIDGLLLVADDVAALRQVEELRREERLVWVTRREEEPKGIQLRGDDVVVKIPDTRADRMSQIKIGLLLAVLNGQIDPARTLVVLSGFAGTKGVDTLVLTSPRRQMPWFREHGAVEEDDSGGIATRELARLVEIGLRFGEEGREGSPIGTTFLLGDPEELAPYLRQLILNPLAGHPKRDRNIHSSDFIETLRELSALDGAFVVTERGVVESAGTYIDAPGRGALVSPGLGARHASAAAITAQSKAVAVVLSQSSHAVTVYRAGRAILRLGRTEVSG